MTAYEQAHAEALKAMEKYDAVPYQGRRSPSHQVTNSGTSGVIVSKYMARVLGKSVQQIKRAIHKFASTGRQRP